MKYSCFGERLIQQVERRRQVILFGGELPLQPGNQVNVLGKHTYQICNTCIFLNNTHFVWKANIVLEKKILNQFIGKPVHYYLVFEGHDINVSTQHLIFYEVNFYIFSWKLRLTEIWSVQKFQVLRKKTFIVDFGSDNICFCERAIFGFYTHKCHLFGYNLYR